MHKLYEIEGIVAAFPKYTHDEADIKSDSCVTEGYFITPAELEARERKAFEAARSMVEEVYPMRGRIGYQFETFDDYKASEDYK